MRGFQEACLYRRLEELPVPRPVGVPHDGTSGVRSGHDLLDRTPDLLKSKPISPSGQSVPAFAIAKRRILRLHVRRGLLTAAQADDMLGWRETGSFRLDGSVRVTAHDPAGLERLLEGHRRGALVVA